ncbi:MAG: hypothetical protein MEP57_01930 [Microvirga sp.]|nr:hypothetical protein [Microvirga sp.]
MKEPLTLLQSKSEPRDAEKAPPSMTLGREAIFRINALEGLTPSKGMLERLAEFDRQGLTPEQWRAEVIRNLKRLR